MNLKLFDIYEGLWIDVSGQAGSQLQYDDVSGWTTSSGYKKYVAKIDQSGSSAPTAIVLENTLGFTPDWKYDSDGVYGFDFDGYDFDEDKCLAYLSLSSAGGKAMYIKYIDVYDITLRANDGDDSIQTTTLEIRYYN